MVQGMQHSSAIAAMVIAFAAAMLVRRLAGSVLRTAPCLAIGSASQASKKGSSASSVGLVISAKPHSSPYAHASASTARRIGDFESRPQNRRRQERGQCRRPKCFETQNNRVRKQCPQPRRARADAKAADFLPIVKTGMQVAAEKMMFSITAAAND